MSSLSQNLSKLWQFLWVKVRWNLNFSKFWNLEISLNFWDFCPIFCMWAQFLNIFNLCIPTWGLKQLLPWFQRGVSDTPPRREGNRQPLGNRVKVDQVEWLHRVEKVIEANLLIRSRDDPKLTKTNKGEKTGSAHSPLVCFR